MRVRILLGLAALALAAATSAVARSSSQSAQPTLSLVRRAPLAIRGAHFRSGERVRVTAAAGTTSATATATTTPAGRLLVRFHYTAPPCLKLVVQATGSRGDRARLVLRPPGGPAGAPCGE